jgi:methyl-accepting chemotaxis protein
VQMDEVTQQNAALVEEAAASAEAMQEQAGSLMRAVSMFKLGSGKQGTRTVAAKPVAAPAVTHQTQPPFGDEKRLSMHPKERKLVKANDDTDGDWKEF